MGVVSLLPPCGLQGLSTRKAWCGGRFYPVSSCFLRDPPRPSLMVFDATPPPPLKFLPCVNVGMISSA